MYPDIINYLSATYWQLSSIEHYYDFNHQPIRGMITVSMEPPASYSGESLLIDMVIELILWPPVIREVYLIRYNHPEDQTVERPISSTRWHPSGVQVYSLEELLALLAPYGLNSLP